MEKKDEKEVRIMKTMGPETYRDMLLAAGDRILRLEPVLTRIDGAIGDGDHGIGMRNGMTAARRALTAAEPGTGIAELSRLAGDAMRNAMGGASGMIFSTLLTGGSGAFPGSGAMRPCDFAAQMRAGLRAIQELGHAEEGDKTMVDALAPAVRAMEEHTESFEEMLLFGAHAAGTGAEKTKGYQARFGRSKNLGARALGHADAGAVSTWQLFVGMSDFVSGMETPLPDPGDPGMPAAGSQTLSGGKKILNDPADAVREEAEGFLAAFGRDVAAVPGVSGLVRRNIPEGKTALLVGGGSGHEPMFGFFLGENLADASANGNVFTSPDPRTIAETAKAAERGAGVLFLYGNYEGDKLNFDRAASMLAEEGIPTRTVRIRDDAASAPKDRREDRRGIAGDVLMLKIAGAACASLSLDEAYRVVSKANDSLFSAGVALGGCTIPGQKEPLFTLPPDEMEFGLGIHGEPGVKRVRMQSADEITESLLNLLLEESGIQRGDRVVTYVNGLGSTTLMELMIMNRRLALLLKEKGILVHGMDVGSFVTSMEMAGASISLLKLDDELRAFYDLPCRSPYYSKP